MTVTDTNIYSNKARYGGGVYISGESTSVSFDGCNIYQNTALLIIGAVSPSGMALSALTAAIHVSTTTLLIMATCTRCIKGAVSISLMALSALTAAISTTTLLIIIWIVTRGCDSSQGERV